MSSCVHFTYISSLIQVQLKYFQTDYIHILWDTEIDAIGSGLWLKFEPCFSIYISIIAVPTCLSVEGPSELHTTIPWIHQSDQASPLL